MISLKFRDFEFLENSGQKKYSFQCIGPNLNERSKNVIFWRVTQKELMAKLAITLL